MFGFVNGHMIVPPLDYPNESQAEFEDSDVQVLAVLPPGVCERAADIYPEHMEDRADEEAENEIDMQQAEEMAEQEDDEEEMDFESSTEDESSESYSETSSDTDEMYEPNE